MEEFMLMMVQSIEKEFRYSITHWFQPIYHLKNNSILGYEALLRDASQLQTSPVQIFKEAEKNGYQNILDIKSIKTALKTFQNKSNLLFLNVLLSTLLERDFISWWDMHVPALKPIVLELLESEQISNWEELKVIIKELRQRHVKIAIDDMGGGYSFFQQWIELDPDFIKLDRYFAENLSISTRKQKTVESLLDLFSNTTELIIEGVETEEDLDIAELLGIPYAQGYLLGRPSPLEKIITKC